MLAATVFLVVDCSFRLGLIQVQLRLKLHTFDCKYVDEYKEIKFNKPVDLSQ